mgnify:CR=1 FL=1
MLLLGGYGWCAHSPLAYTLSRNSKYCHFGYTKDMRYLEYKHSRLVFNNNKPIRQLQNIYNLLKDNSYTNWQSDIGHKMNLSIDLDPLKDFPLLHLENLLNGLTTPSKLITFYKQLYYHISQRGYTSVSDSFTGAFVRDPNHLHKSYFKSLQDHFDTKFIFIMRDPVRRAFSESLRHYNQFLRRNYHCDYELSLPSYKNTSPPSKDPVLPGTTYQQFLDQNQWSTGFRNIDYIGNLLKAQKIFGKNQVHCAIMEELWEGTDGTSSLSQFLDHPIDNLWSNAYAPDTGHLIQSSPDSPCQATGQHLQELTPTLYYKIKVILQSTYDNYQSHFGSLPLFWGEPLKYPEGKPLTTTA